MCIIIFRVKQHELLIILCKTFKLKEKNVFNICLSVINNIEFYLEFKFKFHTFFTPMKILVKNENIISVFLCYMEI